MNQLALFLKILTEANMATPAIIGIIDIITSGKESGKTDEEIQAESMAFALETRRITDEDRGPQA